MAIFSISLLLLIKSIVLNSVSCLLNSHDGDQSGNYVTKKYRYFDKIDQVRKLSFLQRLILLEGEFVLWQRLCPSAVCVTTRKR